MIKWYKGKEAEMALVENEKIALQERKRIELEQQKARETEIKNAAKFEETKKQAEKDEAKRVRQIFAANLRTEVPQGEDPKEFVRINYGIELNCPNLPEQAYGGIYSDTEFGPYFLPLTTGNGRIKLGTENGCERGRTSYGTRFIKITALPVTLDKIVEDGGNFREKINEAWRCCDEAEVTLRTKVFAGDGGLLAPQVKKKIAGEKTWEGILTRLGNLAYLYERAGMGKVAETLRKHYSNLFVGDNQPNAIQMIGFTDFTTEATHRKIFAKEFEKLDGYQAEIKALALNRDSEIAEFGLEIKGYGSKNQESALTNETMTAMRGDIIGRYDLQIRKLYADIKSIGLQDKVKELEVLAHKAYNEPRKLTRNEYKFIYQAARKARRNNLEVME